jgi:hypothetical protein
VPRKSSMAASAAIVGGISIVTTFTSLAAIGSLARRIMPKRHHKKGARAGVHGKGRESF